jgi:hypothetical protein
MDKKEVNTEMCKFGSGDDTHTFITGDSCTLIMDSNSEKYNIVMGYLYQFHNDVTDGELLDIFYKYCRNQNLLDEVAFEISDFLSERYVK